MTNYVTGYSMCPYALAQSQFIRVCYAKFACLLSMVVEPPSTPLHWPGLTCITMISMVLSYYIMYMFEGSAEVN